MEENDVIGLSLNDVDSNKAIANKNALILDMYNSFHIPNPV